MPETLLDKRIRAANECLAAGGFLRNPRTSPFNTLALTCMSCGAIVSTPPDWFRKVDCPNAGKKVKCPCYSRRGSDEERRRTVEDETYRTTRYSRLNRAANRANATSRDGAHRHGQPWTGPELEIVARRDLSASQVAKLTGRTMWSVRAVRAELKSDPRRIVMAGVVD